jgi:hypothetical protein
MLDFWDYLIYTSYIASFEVLSLFKTIKLPLGAVRVKTAYGTCTRKSK